MLAGMLVLSLLAHGALLLSLQTPAPIPAAEHVLHTRIIHHGEPSAAAQTVVPAPPPAAPITPPQPVIHSARGPLATSSHTASQPTPQSKPASPPQQQQPVLAHAPAPPAPADKRPAATSDSAAGSEASLDPELLRLLYAAIDHHKRYPLSALRMGREGTTRVGFRLNPDGGIEHLQLSASSGHRALDGAALRAVAGISPFRKAAHYLSTAQDFQINVMFRVN